MDKRPLRLHKRNWIRDNERACVVTPLGEMFWLNETGAFIWKLCDGTLSTKAIADALVEKYGVEEDTAIKDVLEVISHLEKLGLIGWQ
jgi:methyltransferase-like protein